MKQTKQKKLEEVNEVWDDLRFKYFSDEIKKDKEALVFKKKLAYELTKIIKEIKFYPLAFPSMNQQLARRIQVQSFEVVSKHQDDLREWLLDNSNDEL